MKGWINGIGWVTAAGFGQGHNADRQPFCIGQLTVPSRKQVFDQADKRFGRLDQFSRVGLAAIAYCLRDAGREEWQQKRPIGILASTRFGCLQTDQQYLDSMFPEQGRLASPNLFAYTLPNCFLGEAALRFGLTGNSLVLNQEDPSGLAVLQYGLEELAWGDVQGVLVGVSDLVAPPELEDHQRFPGSLFLLLEKSPSSSSYGCLEMVDGRLELAGQLQNDLPALVAACLMGKKRP